ncbi:MAG: hypothetical protein IPN17_24510 [Deltaproteobacteria bacterium]|nr:hypothetical protein [Deltaproteobacteria bacterium]
MIGGEAQVGAAPVVVEGRRADAPRGEPRPLRLAPLHRELGEPQPGDWLYEHEEPGQTFVEYRACDPTRPGGRRRILAVQPIGTFTAGQQRIVELAAEFLTAAFGLPVRTLAPLPLSVIPAEARRRNPYTGGRQFRATHILREVLAPAVPKDAAAVLGFTGVDLYSSENSNFVFGLASRVKRVGVWSLARSGSTIRITGGFKRCLRRTIKTAAHETGHTFGMRHCTAAACNMNGSNGRKESDRRPLAFCPDCLAKVCWAGGLQPTAHLRAVAAFCRENGLEAEARFHEESLAKIDE